eukprot:g7854.t1
MRQEYSPEFALRSYAYVELYALPVRLAKVFGLNKVQAFYLLRSTCGSVSALGDAWLRRAGISPSGAARRAGPSQKQRER